MSQTPNTQQALSDLEALKQAILTKNNQSPLGIGSVVLHKSLHVIALIIVTILIITDLPNGHFLTTDVMASVNDPWLQRTGIITVGGTLALFLIIGYILLFVQAKKQNQKLGEYTSRYFTYFKSFSLFSDLFVKYAAFCAIVLAGKPEWVAPALLLFTGDWIIQGRFFVLSQKLSMVLGLACFAGATAIFATGTHLIIIPLAAFLAIGLISLIGIMKFKAKLKTQNVSE